MPLAVQNPSMERCRRWEQRTAGWLTALAVISLADFVLSAALGRSRGFTDAVDYLVWGAFATDYAVRLYLTPPRDRRHFVRSHPLDLLAVIVPAIRALRVIAVFLRIEIVASRSRSERLLTSTAFVALTVVLAGASAVLRTERTAPGSNIHSFSDAAWWALTTVSTVGYGDRYPVTAEGRVIGGALMIVGIGVMGMVTSALAYRFITTSEDPDAPSLDVRLKQLEARLDEMTVLLRRQND
jgi:voltage-gated potassium channel